MRFFAFAVRPVAYVFDPSAILPGAILGVTTTFSASISQARWAVPGYLVGALLVMNTLEIASSYFGKDKAARSAFPWEEKTTGKLLLFFVFIVALILDGTMFFASQLLPEQTLPILHEGYLPLTISSLFWFLIAESTRVIHNVARTQGDNMIPPILRRLIGAEAKEAEEHLGRQVPQRRRLDNLTDEEIKELMKRHANDLPAQD